MLIGGVVRLVDDEVGRASAAGADVAFGGIKMHIGGNILPGLDQKLTQDSFRGTPLVGG